MLLSDINNYLYQDAKFPFEEEKERMQYNEDNSKAFEGLYGEIGFFQEQFKRCEEELSTYNDTILNVLPINYNEEIVETTKNLVFNKDPVLNVDIQEDFIDITKEALIDFLRFGSSVVHTYLEKGLIKHSIINPKNYYPVFNKLNKKEIVQHCVIYQLDREVYVFIHTPGKTTFKLFSIKWGKIGSLLKEEEYPTGLNESAITVIKNSETSENVYGKSLFDKINVPLAQIFVGMTQINRVLDKSIDPMLVIPESAIDYDENGQAYFKIKNALIMNSKDDPKPERITWDANLEAAFNNLNLWFKKLADVSGLGPIILDTNNEVMAGLSGEAMRRLNSKCITTVNNLRSKIRILIKMLLRKEFSLLNKKLDNLEIEFEDLFMDSDSEKLNYITRRLEAGTISRVESIMYLDDISEEEAIEKLRKIKKEEPESIDLGDEDVIE